MERGDRAIASARMSNARRRYRIHLHNVKTLDVFASAFNEGLIGKAGGHWNGKSWDAFNDYLSWPADDSYILVLDGWTDCDALSGRDLEIFEEILAANQHVSVERT